MKKYLLLFTLATLFSFVFIACEDDSTGPDPVGDVGSLNIQSLPQTGATIFIEGQNKGTTNRTITNVAVGTRTIRLELQGYKDTTFTVTILKDQETLKVVRLTSSIALTKYGPVRIWETTGTGVDQPSGLDLSTENTHGISVGATGRENVDLYYYTNSGFTTHELRSANQAAGLTRVTRFKVGTGTDLNDTIDASGNLTSWLNAISDEENNYFFTFDDDDHYSKVRITSSGGTGQTGDPAWVELEWWYNQTADDPRFGDDN